MSWRPVSVVTIIVSGLCLLPRSVTAQPPDAGDLNELQEQVMRAAVQRVAPSVVQIETSGGTEIIGIGGRGMQVRKGVGPTTGLVIAVDGYVISSAFNFANKPTAIFVSVPGHKERYVARAVATDQTRMVTLLKITATGLQVPPVAPKKEIHVGQWSLALGRTLDPNLDHPPSVSAGIISALGRIWGKAIQTDAKVSPVNYGGPLIDMLGRVQGVLVPAAPRGEGETAGVEWYDSGIGFAVPLEDIYTVLGRLKEGKDLKRGLLGIMMQSGDIYGVQPVVASVIPESAASKAGIKTGDIITAIDNQPIVRQAQIMHMLGNKYEGDVVSVKIKRRVKDKDEEIRLDNLKLTGELQAFAHSFLGILPMRDDPEVGVEVRYVYPQSPADKAGIKAGDRILKIGPGGTPALQAFSGRDQMLGILNTLTPGSEVKLEVARKEPKKTETLTVRLGTLPDAVPDKLPADASLKKALEPRKQPAGAPQPPVAPRKEEPKKKPETGLLKRTNAARDHEYWVYVPKNYDPNVAHALVLWLHPAGKPKPADDLVDIWEDACKDQHIILVGPKAENDTGWLPGESEAVQQAVKEVLDQYTIDRQRVVAHGMGIGGEMAFYLGFYARDLVRGVATASAVLTRQPKDNLANQRLAFFLIAARGDPLVKNIEESKAKLAEQKFPVIYRTMAGLGQSYPDGPEFEELVRWIDSLDRL